MTPTDKDVTAVEEAIGMGHQAWDCVDPKQIIAAAWAQRPEALAQDCAPEVGIRSSWNACQFRYTCQRLLDAQPSPRAAPEELTRLRKIEHAAWHALEAAEEREDCLIVPIDEGTILSELLPESHPGNDNPLNGPNSL